MNLPSRAALMTAGIAATATLLGPAVASASPVSSVPLVQSTCSFAQIDAAIHATAPSAANLLDAYPQVKQELAVLFAEPVEHRQKAVDRYLAANPHMGALAEQVLTGPRSAMIQSTLAVVADTCHSY